MTDDITEEGQATEPIPTDDEPNDETTDAPPPAETEDGT